LKTPNETSKTTINDQVLPEDDSMDEKASLKTSVIKDSVLWPHGTHDSSVQGEGAQTGDVVPIPN